MKNKIIIISLILIALVIPFKFVEAGGNEELKAKQSVVEYFEATKHKDIEKMLVLSNDFRVESDEEHKALLEEAFNNEDQLIEDYKINNIEALGDNVFNFRVSIKYKTNDFYDGIDLLVIKNNGKYIIQIGFDR